MNNTSADSVPRQRVPFRWKFFAFMLLSVAVPLLTVAWLAISWSRSSLVEAGREQNQIILGQMQTILQQNLDQLDQAISSLEDAGAVRVTFDFSAANGFVPAQLKDELRALAGRLRLVHRIRMIDAGDQIIADTDSSDGSLDEPARLLIEKLRRGDLDRDFGSRFVIVDGHPLLLVVREIRASQDKSFVGYLLVDIAPKKLFESVQILRFDNYPHAFGFVIDRDKRLLAHPDSNQILQSVSAENLDLGIPSRLDATSNVEWREATIYGIDFYCSTVWMDNPRWVLGMAIPQQEFDASIIALSFRLLVITAIATTMVTVAVCWISGYTSQKVEQSRQLELSRQLADADSRSKSEFLANMSHEIRTPLNGILGFTELLIRGTDGGNERERTDYLNTIRSSGKHLLQLVNDVLDLSKIEAGQLQVETITCSPHPLLAEVVSVMRVPARKKGVELDYRWETGIPETIQSDPHRLKQLLMNLVSNAIKFTDEGSVLVVAKLLDAGEKPLVQFQVRDTGIGIPPNKLESIFQPFVQADTSVTRNYGGTGLGLSISHRIAKSLGGDLTVESNVGHGSVFTVAVEAGDLSGVTIAAQPPVAIAIAGDVSSQAPGVASLEGLKVLLVDDGPTNRKLISLFLTRSGVTVELAENGALAVHAAEQTPFDVILMDMQMPVMDGYTATTRLREMGYQSPIIALTAHAMKGDREKCEAAGCSGYLAKPVNMDELIRTVQLAAGASAAEPVPSATPSPPPTQQFHSTLPTDDREIRAAVAEFIDSIDQRLDSMSAALAAADFDELERLAHTLKGSGGTAGFYCFTDPAEQIEKLAQERNRENISETIGEIRHLKHRLAV